MGREKQDVGALGERIALDFLKRKNYKITGINIRTPFGELDIVSRLGKTIVFVEVRTRTTSSFGLPSHSITYHKKRKLILNSLWYLSRYNLTRSDWRIDVIGIKINLSGQTEDIQHIENAIEDIY